MKKHKRLKILYTIPNFDTAGSGKVLYDLAKGLDTDRFEAHIACSHDRGAFFEEVKKLALPIHIIETTCKLRPYYSLLNRILPYKNFIKLHKFDIVHSWHWSSDWTEVIAAKWGGAQFVYTKKAMTWGRTHWRIRSYLADFIIFINDEMAQYFPNKKQKKLIPLGIDIDYYKPDVALKRQEHATFNIITVANLVPVKGIEVLIDAVALLKNRHIVLTILGDDTSTYATALKEKVTALQLTDDIRFLGKHINIKSYLDESDLYIIPSYKEGMPMALVEAMSMGIPVLGSDVSGINFVLKAFTELLFKAGDAEALAKKIDSFINMSPEQRASISCELRRYVVEHFSITGFLKAHEDLYLSLVKRS